MNMKRICFIAFLLCFTMHAQELDIDSGASITLGTGTKLNVVGLELNTAVADFELTGPYSIQSSTTPVDTNGNPSIGFVFTNGLMTNYKGTIVLNYGDADLNGLSEDALVLEFRDGSGVWQAFETTDRNVSNNTLTIEFDNASPITFQGVTAAETEVSLGISDDATQTKIYPNPTQGLLKIESEATLLLQLYDMQGRKLMETEEKNIQLTHLPNAVYMLKVTNTDKGTVGTHQIIKQ